MTAAEFADARSRLLMLARALMDDRPTMRAALVRLEVCSQLDGGAMSADARSDLHTLFILLTAANMLALDADAVSARPLPQTGVSPA